MNCFGKKAVFLCEILTQFSHVYMNPHTEFTTYNLKYKCRQEEVFIMTEHNKNENKSNQLTLSAQVRELVQSGLYDDCYKVIVDEMKNSPHAPEPHNLMGMLLERQGDHLLAMKHFRASWDLDPTYLPARHNLEVYGSFFSRGTGAYDESDCPTLEEKNPYKLEYDKNNIGHVVRRNTYENQ